MLINSYARISPSGPFPSGATIKTLNEFFFTHTRSTRPTHLILLNVITRIIFGEQ